MTADKRTVTTDALETLGSIITENEKRDAIHLAVDNVVAAHTLRPGEDVGFLGDGTVGTCDAPVGIVDPFLKTAVKKGERFWLVVYPRQITSLRHVWTHPAFPEVREVADLVEAKPVAASQADPVAASRRWIEEFAASIDQTYNRLMSAVDNWVEYQEYTRDDSEAYKEHWDRFPEFWDHYEVVTGKNLSGVDRDSFFTCSC